MTTHLAGDVGVAVAELRSTEAIRQRAQQLLTRARAGDSAWWEVHDDALASTADEVAAVARQRYPDLNIPFHSRWRHFEAGGVDRVAALGDRLPADPADRARTLIDLVVVSVLLDAGAGPGWSFTEPGTGLRIERSEGLAVASWHAFLDGRFSSDPADPLRVDAAALLDLSPTVLATSFQVSESNPLVGLDGRAALLNRLGAALDAAPEVFGGRPGGLYDAVVAKAADGAVPAHRILSVLLSSLSGIWLADNMIGTVPVGDCWRHDAVHGGGLSDGWMPFHKLSQWLTYSLLEPFAWSGVEVVGLDELTALPEYRNGGLLLDTGVLTLRDPALTDREWAVSDEAVIEWRALTVALIDELAPLVRDRLGVDADALPLACILEGGTWAAGRALAQRRGGLPPLTIRSDGTVF
ncbi:URC4/urg3 family protein [Gordonia sp. CPCC 205515]|uniref:URC4/urg3 family protein n=1 Tax=Gordonia sp. CPCC 205515 TaxID=3140791 RepID=UPI003AF379F2